MKGTLIAILLLLIGGGAGFFLADSLREPSEARTASRVEAADSGELRLKLVEDEKEIARLRAELDRLLKELTALKASDEPERWPGDTPEKVERLLHEAYADNNVDWLMEVIERLLAMGERGYPILRRMVMDIAFKAKFVPTQSDFRADQIYTMGKVFTRHEKQFIGFLNYLLTEPNTNPMLKQGAMVLGAWYVGSNAPGADELQQTLMQIFMQEQGVNMMGQFMPGNIGKKMQVWSMAMSGDPKMIGPLRRELDGTRDKKLQSDIIGALAYLGDPKAVPLIQERLDPTQGDFRSELRSLGRIDTEESHQVANNFLRAIPDSKRFYRHVGGYIRSGGGTEGVMLMQERIKANPDDPEIGQVIGSLRRYPTQESKDTLDLISQTSANSKTADRAGEAAAEIDRKLRGEIPEFPPR